MCICWKHQIATHSITLEHLTTPSADLELFQHKTVQVVNVLHKIRLVCRSVNVSLTTIKT